MTRRSYLLPGGDSRSGTPVGASTPKSESLAGDHSLSDAPDSAVEGFKVNMGDDDDDEVTRDISVHVSQVFKSHYFEVGGGWCPCTHPHPAPAVMLLFCDWLTD